MGRLHSIVSGLAKAAPALLFLCHPAFADPLAILQRTSDARIAIREQLRLCRHAGVTVRFSEFGGRTDDKGKSSSPATYIDEPYLIFETVERRRAVQWLR
jgi:hypothetical protein